VKHEVRCEVCGHKIHAEPITAIIEGARLTVCVECSKHGKIITQDEYTLRTNPTTAEKQTAHAPIFVQKKRPEIPTVQITQEIIEDYSTKIRQAREKLGLTHEDLGRKINEKSFLIIVAPQFVEGRAETPTPGSISPVVNAGATSFDS